MRQVFEKGAPFEEKHIGGIRELIRAAEKVETTSRKVAVEQATFASVVTAAKDLGAACCGPKTRKTMKTTPGGNQNRREMYEVD